MATDLNNLDNTKNNLCAYYPGTLERWYTQIDCKTPMTGQHVKIMFNTTTYFYIYEIEMHGTQ